MSRKITVYSKESCVQCNVTKRDLDTKNVEYEVILADARGNEELADSIRARQQETRSPNQMPYVTVYDSDNNLIADWFGYRPDMINDHAAVQDEDVAA